MGAAEKLDLTPPLGPLREMVAVEVERAASTAPSVLLVLEPLLKQVPETLAQGRIFGWCAPPAERAAYIEDLAAGFERLAFMGTPTVRRAVRRQFPEIAAAYEATFDALGPWWARGLAAMRGLHEAYERRLAELAAQPQDPVLARISKELGDRADDHVVMTADEIDAWLESGAEIPEERWASST